MLWSFPAAKYLVLRSKPITNNTLPQHLHWLLSIEIFFQAFQKSILSFSIPNPFHGAVAPWGSCSVLLARLEDQGGLRRRQRKENGIAHGQHGGGCPLRACTPQTLHFQHIRYSKVGRGCCFCGELSPWDKCFLCPPAAARSQARLCSEEPHELFLNPRGKVSTCGCPLRSKESTKHPIN